MKNSKFLSDFFVGTLIFFSKGLKIFKAHPQGGGLDIK